MADQLDRLLTQLNTSGLSQQNNALFQIIQTLIKEIKKLRIELNGFNNSGGGTTIVNNIINESGSSMLTPLDLMDDRDSIIPGPPGKDGINGKDGVPGMDGEPGEDGIFVFLG